MTTSRNHVEMCLSKLEAAGFRLPRALSTPEGFAASVGIWTDMLRNYHPHAVTRAVDGWIKSGDGWPLPRDILRAVDGEQARLERRLQAPQTADVQAELNAALNAAMAFLPGALLVRVYTLGHDDPRGKRRWVRAFAEWAHGELPPPPWPADYRPPVDELHAAAARMLDEAASLTGAAA